jgi:hypothetical protein
MQRIAEAGGLFIAGNPSTNTKGTIVSADWLNSVQEELATVVLDGGDTLNPLDNGQVLAKIKDLILTHPNAVAPGGGTANAQTAAFTPPVTELSHGMMLFVRCGTAANTTATPTFTPNSGVIAAKTIVKNTNDALVAGDIDGTGHWLQMMYDLTSDRWVLLNPATGMVPYATAAEAQAFTVTNRPISPATLASALQGTNQSLAANGYQKLPGGLILQWGTYDAVAASSGTITFPIPFPNACYGCYPTDTNNNATQVAAIAALATTTNFAWAAAQGATPNAVGVFNWFARGR